MRFLRALALAVFARFATERAQRQIDIGNRCMDRAQAARERGAYWTGRAEWAHRRVTELYPTRGRRHDHRD